MYVYDTVTRKWTDEVPFQSEIEGIEHEATAILDGCIYMMSGNKHSRTAAKRMNRVDRFDMRTKRWQELAPMPTNRSGFKAVAMDGKLYVVGGDSDVVECLAPADRYDPSTDTWETIASMTEKRYNPGVAELNGMLYVVGGCNIGTLKSAEVYDPQSNTWSRLPDMAIARSGLAVVGHAGNLYVMGGQWQSRNVEVFHSASNTWGQLTARMQKSARDCVACVFDKPVWCE